MHNQKNTTLELLKLFASYMVVFVHVSFSGTFGTVMETLARFSVPFFFLVSGYYSYAITPSKIKVRIRRLVRLLIVAAVAYTVFNLWRLLPEGGMKAVKEYFGAYIGLKALIKLFVFNMPVSSLHLWYLFASVNVYLVFYFVTLWRWNDKVVYGGSFFLLFLHILLGEGLAAFGIVTPVPMIRNFVMTGIPFFALGLLAKKHEDKLRKLPNYVLILAVAAGIPASICSRCFFGKNEIYMGSLLILFAMVIVFIKYSDSKYPRFLNALTGCSTHVYIFHIMVSYFLVKGYRLLHLDPDSSLILINVHPILVCIVSTVLAYAIIQATSKRQRKKAHHAAAE